MKNYTFVILILVFTMFFNSCNTKEKKVSDPDLPRLTAHSEQSKTREIKSGFIHQRPIEWILVS